MIVASILAVYLFGVFTLTITMRGFENETRINFIPFRAIYKLLYELANYLRAWKTREMSYAIAYIVAGLRNIIGNILLFIPLGFMASILRKSFDKWWKACLLGIGVSMIIEIMQFFTHSGYSDIDDIVLNSIGCIVGFLCFHH